MTDLIVKPSPITEPVTEVREHMGIVTATTRHPDGREDVHVTVNTVWANADPSDFAQKIAVDILERFGGSMRIDDFSREFRKEAERQGIKVDDIPIIGG